MAVTSAPTPRWSKALSLVDDVPHVRNTNCSNYGICLAETNRRTWRGFKCPPTCGGNDSAPPPELDDDEQTRAARLIRLILHEPRKPARRSNPRSNPRTAPATKGIPPHGTSHQGSRR